MRKFLIIFGLIVVILAVTIYAGKEFFLAKFKIFLVGNLESSLQRGVTIKRMGYIPVKGIALSGVTVYADKSYREKEATASRLYVKIPIIKLLTKKVFSPTITIRDLSFKNADINGSFGFSMKLGKKIGSPEQVFDVIQSVSLANFSVKSPLLNIKDASGTVIISPTSVKTEGFRFVLNGEPYTLDLKAINPAGDVSSSLEISSPNFKLVSSLKKEKDVYKIPEIKGTLLNSSFEFMGEFESIKGGVFSLYGKTSVDMKDVYYFVPEKFKKRLESARPEGVVLSSIYFKGNPKDLASCEGGLKSDAAYLKMGNFKINEFHMEAQLKDGLLELPILNAYPYNGVLVASAKLDLTGEGLPYRAGYKLRNIDISAILKNTPLGAKGIKGVLSSEIEIEGRAKDINSVSGSGNIIIKNANLGPMPLLTPLLGHVYGYLQHVLPELKKVNIQDASCDFTIENRKIMSNNIVLEGESVGIYGKGYMDFDTNLNFEVENQIAGPEQGAGEDWQTNLQQMIVQVGKIASKAYLTGTLEKPKWKFQYLGGMQNILKGGLKGGLGEKLKGIFER